MIACEQLVTVRPPLVPGEYRLWMGDVCQALLFVVQKMTQDFWAHCPELTL